MACVIFLFARHWLIGIRLIQAYVEQVIDRIECDSTSLSKYFSLFTSVIALVS